MIRRSAELLEERLPCGSRARDLARVQIQRLQDVLLTAADVMVTV